MLASKDIVKKYEKIEGNEAEILWQLIYWYEFDNHFGEVNYKELGRYFEELIEKFKR